MSDKTFIKGKDSDLESTIETMLQKLQAIDIEIEEASWLNPVPNVYSVHIRDKECGLMFTNGKGASRKACLASALGEYFERLSCNYFFADFYLGKDYAEGDFVHYPDEQWIAIDEDNFRNQLLDDTLWRYYDPETALKAAGLFELNSGTGERGICAIPFRRERDQKTILFPVNIIGNLYVSNGMSAGNTKNEARVQSLSEVFERYVKNKIIAEGICLPEVPQAVLDRFPKIVEAIDELQNHGYHLRIADASLGGRYPVMSVTLINPENASVFASFGAHPSFEVALERTVTELLQGRGLDQLDGFQSPSFDLDEVADHHNLETHFIDSSGLIAYDFFKSVPDYEFADWDHDATTESEFDYLCKLIHDSGHDIYIADYEHLDVYTCRIIVPGMSDIYPVDDLVWANNNEGAHFREQLLSLHHLDKTRWLDLVNRLDEGGYNDYQRVAEFIGVAPDAGTAWASLRIGELKAMLCLAAEDYTQAIDWIDWCIQIEQLDKQRHQLYECLHALTEIKLQPSYKVDELSDSLKLLFGEDCLNTAMQIIDNEIQFYGLHSPGLSLEGFNSHNKLLEGYEKLQRAKRKHWRAVSDVVVKDTA